MYEFKVGDKVNVDGLDDYITSISAIYEDKNGVMYNIRWTNDEGTVQNHYYVRDEITLI